MKKTIIGALVTVVTLIVAGCAATIDYPRADIAAGAEVFRKCKACHSSNPSRGTFGPQLVGVYMREAGSVPGFDYSEELKAATFLWDDNHLRDWIAHNKMVLAGTRMRHVSVTDPAEQDYLIAYLRYLSDYPKKYEN